MITRFAMLLLLLAALPAAAQERISHGNFKDVALYRPQGEARQAVLLLSDGTGWNASMDATARGLAGQGALVAGIDVAQLRAYFARDGGDCVFPAGDLENLSHYLQGYAQQPTYRVPLLVGQGTGAALAYAMLAQSQADVFAGAVSIGFRPRLDLGKTLCQGKGKFFTPGKGSAVMLLPAPRALPAPWVALQGARDGVYSVADMRGFAGAGKRASVSAQPQLTHDDRDAAHWLPALLAAAKTLGQHGVAAVPPPPWSLSDLPLIEVPASGTGRDDTFAILLSGDGGWAGLDKDVAAALAAKGIPVVGFDSLRYFWHKRTPQGLASDLDRTLRYYTAHWHRPKVLLVGYSQGADVLPFAVNRLPAASKALLSQAVLMGLGDNASFEFHVGNWMSDDDADGLPILPEARRLDAARTLCVYGEGEDDSLCPKIPPGHVQLLSLPGGHHFDGDYGRLADAILSRP